MYLLTVITLVGLYYEREVSGLSVSPSESCSRRQLAIESWQPQEGSWAPQHTSIWLCVIHTLNIQWPLVGYVVTSILVAQQFQRVKVKTGP